MNRDFLHDLIDDVADSKLEDARKRLEKLRTDRRDFVFGVDLDGVCADFYGGLRPIAAEWLGVSVDTLTEQISWELREWGLDQAPGGYIALHRYAVTQCDLFRKLKPVEGAAQALRRLSEKDIRIRIITHRLFIKYFHRRAIDQTIEWLDRYDIPYWDLCFMKDKAAVGADLYIDDSPENVKELRAGDHETIIFSNSTNRHLQGLRANDWNEAERIVLARMEEWKYKPRNCGLSAI
jgi:5'(3')-deoxyribonucleotidase